MVNVQFQILLPLLHLAASILAAWRLTELFTHDRLTAGVREKLPSYLWQCPRCVSVWAGAWCTLAFAFFPWLNWPFALAWLYLVHNDWIASRRLAKQGRRFSAELKDGSLTIVMNEFTQHELHQLVAAMVAPTASGGFRGPGA